MSPPIDTPDHAALDAWIDAHFDEEVRFLQALVQVPTDTPPGNNAPHALRTAELLAEFGYQAEAYPVPESEVHAYGLQSLTNLIVRRRFDESPCHCAQCPRRRCAAGRRLDAPALQR